MGDLHNVGGLRGGLHRAVDCIADRIRTGQGRYPRRRAMPAGAVDNNHIGRLRTIAIVDDEATGENRKVPFQKVDEQALARGKHRPQRDMLARARRPVDDEDRTGGPDRAPSGVPFRRVTACTRRPARDAWRRSTRNRRRAARQRGSRCRHGDPWQAGRRPQAGRSGIAPSGRAACPLNQAAARRWQYRRLTAAIRTRERYRRFDIFPLYSEAYSQIESCCAPRAPRGSAPRCNAGLAAEFPGKTGAVSPARTAARPVRPAGPGVSASQGDKGLCARLFVKKMS